MWRWYKTVSVSWAGKWSGLQSSTHPASGFKKVLTAGYGKQCWLFRNKVAIILSIILKKKRLKKWEYNDLLVFCNFQCILMVTTKLYIFVLFCFLQNRNTISVFPDWNKNKLQEWITEVWPYRKNEMHVTRKTMIFGKREKLLSARKLLSTDLTLTFQFSVFCPSPILFSIFISFERAMWKM